MHTSFGFSARLSSFSLPPPKILGYLLFNGTRVPFNPLAVAIDGSSGSLAMVYTTFSFTLCYSERELRD